MERPPLIQVKREIDENNKGAVIMSLKIKIKNNSLKLIMLILINHTSLCKIMV